MQANQSWKCQECSERLMPKLCRRCDGRRHVGMLGRSECDACDGNGFVWHCPHTRTHRQVQRAAARQRHAANADRVEYAVFRASQSGRGRAVARNTTYSGS